MINPGLVILNHNNSAQIEKLLESIHKQQLPNIICLVDNSESDEEEEKLNQLLVRFSELNIRLIPTSNLGYFQGNLTGVENLYHQSSVNHALILNPDILCNNWRRLIEVLCSYYQTDENCFIVGPKITIPGFSIVSSPIIPFLLWREIAYNLFFPFSNPVLKYFHTRLSKKSGKVFAVEGSCYMIDCKKTIDNKDYFSDIFLYGEETIFGKIAEKNNWNIWFDNSVEALHLHPPGEVSPMYDKYMPLSYTKIAEKFYSNKFALKIFSLSIKYRFKVRKMLVRLMKK